MHKLRQTIFGATTGNCFQTSVACVLELPLEDVPHFISYGKQWYAMLQDWLEEQELSVSKVAFDSLLLEQDGFYLVLGKSPRGTHEHVVIYKGNEPYWDTHPDDTFIDGDPTYIYLIRPRDTHGSK